MKRILVAYATMAGSTAEVARAVGEEITARGFQVDVLPVGQVMDLAPYDGVVLGGPMIVGWHRSALGFLRTHRRSLASRPLAAFALAISLTKTDELAVDGVPVAVDHELPKAPVVPGHLNFRERYAQLANYVRPILRAAGPCKPVSVGVFGGRLEYGRLPWWGVVFVMLIIRARAGDRRNWSAIRAWAGEAASKF